MASTQKLKQRNISDLELWLSEKTDEELREYISEKLGKFQLNRSAISSELEIPRSSLYTNATLFKLIKERERKLERAGIISQNPLPKTDRSALSRSADAQRLKQLEEQNAALRAEVGEMRSRLEKVDALKDFLMETGRLPRVPPGGMDA